MSDDDKKGDERPKINWGEQIRYTVLMVVGVVAVLILMRFLGLRG